MGTRLKTVALALPAAAVITRKITVPAGQREDDFVFQVETEANQYIPFALAAGRTSLSIYWQPSIAGQI